MNRSIADAWKSYRERVLPKTAGRVQIEETRRGFYAGAAAVFSTIVKNASPGEEVTEADLAMMDGIQRELDEFLASFKQREGLSS